MSKVSLISDEERYQELAKESRSLVLASQSPNKTRQYWWGVRKYLAWNHGVGKYLDDNLTKLKWALYCKYLCDEALVQGTERAIKAGTVDDALTALKHVRREQIVFSLF